MTPIEEKKLIVASSDSESDSEDVFTSNKEQITVEDIDHELIKEKLKNVKQDPEVSITLIESCDS
jgi:hypothetical protein